MTICIYGGTFDPPHIGHMHACEAFLEKFEVDKLYIIPTFIPPHKTRSSTVSAQARFEMSDIAFSGISEKIEISDVELKRQGKSYTADTIRYFKSIGNDIIYLLCGTDMFLTLDSWYDPEYILGNSIIVCMRRENDEEASSRIKEKEEIYRSKYKADIRFLDSKAIELSSSEIREIINTERVNNLLSANVLEYIKKNNLYGNE